MTMRVKWKLFCLIARASTFRHGGGGKSDQNYHWDTMVCLGNGSVCEGLVSGLRGQQNGLLQKEFPTSVKLPTFSQR